MLVINALLCYQCAYQFGEILTIRISAFIKKTPQAKYRFATHTAQPPSEVSCPKVGSMGALHLPLPLCGLFDIRAMLRKFTRFN